MTDLRTKLEDIKEFDGKKIEINVCKWNYSFLALNYYLINEVVDEPDILLILDNAEFSQIDGASGKNIGYKKMLETLRTANINLTRTKIVLILSEDKINNKSLIAEIMKLDIQNFYFLDSFELSMEKLKKYLFGPDKNIDDNKIYLLENEREIVEPIIKYVDRIVEKPIIQTEVVEKVIEKTRTVEKIVEFEGNKPDSFKKLILAIWDNAEFGCELAYMAAKVSKLEVLLVDADLLSPKVDLILNINKQPNNIKAEGIFKDSGLNILVDTIEKNVYSPAFFSEACINRKELKNLHILTGNYDIENYEYYTEESYKIFLEKCYYAFDIVIVLVNRSMYDLFTLKTLEKSDFNLIATKPDLLSIRDFNSQIQFLYDKQAIDKDKFKFIGYENKNIGIKNNIFREVTENNFLGYISYSKKREAYRNLKIPYVRRLKLNEKEEYKDVLAYFNISSRRTFANKLVNRFKIIRLKTRSTFKNVLRRFRKKQIWS